MPHVYISTTTFGAYDGTPLDMLKSRGLAYTLNPYKRTMSSAEIATALEESHSIGLLAGTETIDRNVLKNASLKVISRIGVGMDAIDMGAAQERGITIVNTPYVLTDAVAELTMGLMLSLLRAIPQHDREIRRQQWKKHMGLLLSGKRVAVIGYGSIGKRVSQLLVAFGAKVLIVDTRSITNEGIEQVSLEGALESADIVTIHVSTSHEILGEKELYRMQKGAFIINTSRGKNINEMALHQALVSGHIAGAGLDVFCEEPYSGILSTCENVILTAHVGSYAKDARIRMEIEAVENMLAALEKVGAL